MSNRANVPKMNVSSNKNSLTNKITKHLKGTNRIVLGILAVFVLLVLGVIIYWIYNAVQRARLGDDANPILIPGTINAYDPKNQHEWKLPISSGSNSPNLAFTMSFWMYIDDWNYRFGDLKAILVKGNTSGNNAAPGIWLAPRENTLVIRTRTYRPQGNNLEGCDVANIPLQKWVHVAYVLDNRVVDVYIDGKLERSCVLKKLPWLNNGNLHLIPPNQYQGATGKSDVGFFGQLSSVRYFSSALEPVAIARLYNSGPSASHGASAKKPESSGQSGSGASTEPVCPMPEISEASNFWKEITGKK